MILKKRNTGARLMLEHWVAREPGCTPERMQLLEVRAREVVARIDSAFELDEAREREIWEKEQKEWEKSSADQPLVGMEDIRVPLLVQCSSCHHKGSSEFCASCPDVAWLVRLVEALPTEVFEKLFIKS